MTYFWIAIVILAIITEAMTADLVAIWFMPSALIAMVLALLDVPLWIQLVVFFASVGLFLVLSQKLLRKYLKRRPIESTNAESLVGKTAIVTETVNNEAQTGAVRVGGLVWTARAASDDMTLEKGALVVVREINGVKLICEPK